MNDSETLVRPREVSSIRLEGRAEEPRAGLNDGIQTYDLCSNPSINDLKPHQLTNDLHVLYTCLESEFLRVVEGSAWVCTGEPRAAVVEVDHIRGTNNIPLVNEVRLLQLDLVGEAALGSDLFDQSLNEIINMSTHFVENEVESLEETTSRVMSLLNNL